MTHTWLIIALVVLIVLALVVGFVVYQRGAKARKLAAGLGVALGGNSYYDDDDASTSDDDDASSSDDDRKDGEYDEDLSWGGDCAGEYEHIVEGAGPFRLAVRDPWYTMMLSGEKVIEGRLDRKPFDQLKQGDDVTVVRSRPKGDTSEYPGGRYKYNTSVVRVKKYKNFDALLKGEGVDKVYPWKKAADATKIFNEFLPPSVDADSPVIALELKSPK
jgi:ASC-1-like (ASCH) protein